MIAVPLACLVSQANCTEKKGYNYRALVRLAAVLINYRKLRHAHVLFG